MPTAAPTIAVLGALGSGAAALASDLQQRIVPQSAHIVCAHSPDDYPGAALTLLMGLDLPCTPQETQLRETADARLRAALASAGMAYQVVYGDGERRVENALKAIKSIASDAHKLGAEAEFDSDAFASRRRQRAWSCEKCSDPVCEHRLFTSLLAQRS